MLQNFLKTRLNSLHDRRRGERIVGRSIMAYYWNGSVPIPHRVRDISRTGIYLFTEERWYPGTMLQLTLDFKTGTAITPAGAVPVESTRVWAKVVRFAEDGVGFEFMLVKAAERKKMADFIEKATIVGGQSDAQQDV